MNKEIGKLSREYRESLNLSVNEVADKLGKAPSSIYRFENGEHKDPRSYITSYATLSPNGYDYFREVTELLNSEVNAYG